MDLKNQLNIQLVFPSEIYLMKKTIMKWNKWNNLRLGLVLLIKFCILLTCTYEYNFSQLQLIAPEADAFLNNNTIHFSWEYTGADPHFQLFLNDQEIYQGSDPSFSFVLLEPGTYYWSILMKDKFQEFQSPKRYFYLTSVQINDKQPPIITIASHSQNQSVNGIIPISGTIEDESEIKAFYYQVDYGIKHNLELSTEFEFLFNSLEYEDGNHSIFFTAKDAADNQSTYELQLIFDNGQPYIKALNLVYGKTLSSDYMVYGLIDNVNEPYEEIQFWTESQPLGTAEFIEGSDTQWMFQLNIDSFSTGEVILYFGAINEAEQAVLYDNVLIHIDKTFPQIAIETPENNTIINGNCLISGTASDNLGIDCVKIFAREYGETEASYIGQATGTTSWFYYWDTSTILEKQIHLEVRVYDRGGNISNDTLTLFVDNTGPRVTITTPTENQYIENSGGSPFSFTGTIEDAVEITSASYYMDFETPLSLNNPESWVLEMDTTLYNDGPHLFTITAEDVSGNLYKTTRSFYIDNNAPQIISLDLENGEVIVSGNEIFEFYASDSAGIDSVYTCINSDPCFDLSTNPEGYYVLDYTGYSSDIYQVEITTEDHLAHQETLNFTTYVLRSPDLVSPSDGSSSSNPTPNFDFNQVASFNEYRIQVSTSLEFSSSVISEHITGTTFTPLPDLPPDNYYWRVCAEQGTGTGEWSDVWGFTISSMDSPIPLTPLHSEAVDQSNPDFTWQTVAGAVGYQIQLSQDVNFSSIFHQENTDQLNLTLSVPLTDGIWYWRLGADLGGYYSSFTPSRQLLIDTTDPELIIIYPEDNGILITDDALYGHASDLTTLSVVEVQIDGAGYNPATGTYDWTYNLALTSIPSGEHTLDVRTFDEVGRFKEQTITFYTLPPPPLQSPADNSDSLNTKQEFIWEEVDSSIVYRLQVALDSGFSAIVYESTTADLNHIPTEDLPIATLYWRVRAESIVSSQWSSTRILNIRNLDQTILNNPVDNQYLASPQPILEWDPVPSAQSYLLQLSTDAAFNDIVEQKEVITTYSSPSTALENLQYYWRVKALWQGNYGPYSETRSFYILSAPRMLSPDEGEQVAINPPEFQWEAVSFANTYEHHLDSSSTFPSPIIIEQASTNYQLGSALTDGIYYWRVRAKAIDGTHGIWSNTRFFKINTNDPASVSNATAYPDDGEVIVRWEYPADPDISYITIRYSPISYPASINDGNLLYEGSGTNANATGLTNGTLYYISLFTRSAADDASEATQIEVMPNPVTDDMILIVGNTFIMGHSEYASPEHEVVLTDYYIDRFEVTNIAYLRFIKAGGYTHDFHWDSVGWNWKTSAGIEYPKNWNPSDSPPYMNDPYSNQDTSPVVGISYWEAMAYAKWKEKSLCTEAQWEYAAQSSIQDYDFPWGNTFDPNYCNHLGAGDGYVNTAVVGSYSSGASSDGVFELAGNVKEWIYDWYDEYPASQQTDPQGPSIGIKKVIRGGSYTLDTISDGLYFSSYFRDYDFASVPAERTNDLGFRCTYQ